MNLIQRLIGPTLSKIVMPAQTRKDTFQELRKVKSKNGVNIKQQHIDSTGGASINVATFKKRGSPHSKRVIVYAVGNGHGYETKFDKLVYMANKYPDATIVAFNFRNVLASKGIVYGEQDWIDDAKAVVKHVRAQGFANDKILVNGFSLGGAISTMMVAQLYKEDLAQAKPQERDQVKALRIINQRSLSNLVNVLLVSTLGQKVCAGFNSVAYGALAGFGLLAASVGFGLGLSGLAMATFGVAFGLGTGLVSMLHPSFCFALAKPFGNLAGDLTIGRLDALSAYKSIPEDAKDYIIAKNDSKIPKNISLHQGLKSDNAKVKNHLWRQIKPLLHEKEKARGQKELDEINAQLEPLIEKLRNMKDCKIKHAFIPKNGHHAHNDDLNWFTTYNRFRGELNGKDQLSGQQVLEAKINRLFKI